MMPPQVQLHLLVLLSAGKFPISTPEAPGVQGVAVAGMHGTGVRTPRAADVAVATAGFDTVVHMPKGMMFTSGAWSMIVACEVYSA